MKALSRIILLVTTTTIALAEPQYDYGYRVQPHVRDYKNTSVPDYIPRTTEAAAERTVQEEEPEPAAEPHHKASHHQKNAAPNQYKKPYIRPEYCDSKKPPACAKDSKFGYCSVDLEYPFDEVHEALAKSVFLARQYNELKDQSADDLVSDITKRQEENFDYSFYTGSNTFDKTHWVGPEGYMCPSDVVYERPQRAVNAEGEWRVLVNDPSHCTQTQRVEICRQPEAACRLLAPCYHSRCTQKYSFHRILSYDPCYPERGLFIDIYKLPSACSCHIPRKS